MCYLLVQERNIDMNQIKIKNLHKSFGNNKVISNFNLTVNEGEFITFLGPSGCGKTTILRILAGFEKADEGEIEINGNIVDKGNVFIKPQLREISMVFQSYALWPTMNVFENIAYPLKLQKLNKDKIKEKVDNILNLLKITDIKNRNIDEISGGQQQRVSLARSLVSNPRLLLMDEPLSNLDTKLKESLRYEIKAITKKLNTTVIFVTHDKKDAMILSDRIVVMNEGEIVQVDCPYNVYNNPMNEFVATFIGDYNIIEAKFKNSVYYIDELDKSLQLDYTHSIIKLAIDPFNIIISDAKEKNATVEYVHYIGEYFEIGLKLEKTLVRARIDSKSKNVYVQGSRVKVDFNEFIYLGDDYEKEN